MGAEKSSRLKWYAIGLIVIIGVSSVGVWWLFFAPKGPAPDLGIELRIITRHDPTLQLHIETAFLASDLAQDNNITRIAWTQPGEQYWPTVIPTYLPDVAFGGGPTLFDTIAAQGLLAKLNSTYMETVTDRVNDTISGASMKGYDADNDTIWCAAALSSFGFTISKDWLDARTLPYPTHWENLTEPEFGKLLPATPTVAMGNAPGTTSNTRIYHIILQKFGWVKGWETLTRMAGNSRIMPGSTETQAQVETGVTGVCMSIDFYGITTSLRYAGTEYRIPVNGSIINGDPIAICSTSQNPGAAEAFLDFVLSPEGQSHWLRDEINRLPILVEAFDTPRGQTRDDLYQMFNDTIANIGINFSDPLASSYHYPLLYYFESVLTSAQDDLVSCWSAIVSKYRGGTINLSEFETYAAAMAAPVSWNGGSTTFTLAYAQSINDQMASSSSFRATMQSTWTAAAIAQYNTVEASLPP